MKRNQMTVGNPSVIHILVGFGVGLMVAFVMMLLCSFALTMHDFDSAVAVPMSNVCLAVGAAVGGLVCALIHKSKGLIIGAITGFAMFAVITVIAVIVSGGEMSINTPVRLIAMTFLSAIGGVVGVNMSAKRKMI